MGYHGQIKGVERYPSWVAAGDCSSKWFWINLYKSHFVPWKIVETVQLYINRGRGNIYIHTHTEHLWHLQGNYFSQQTHQMFWNFLNVLGMLQIWTSDTGFWQTHLTVIRPGQRPTVLLQLGILRLHEASDEHPISPALCY